MRVTGNIWDTVDKPRKKEDNIALPRVQSLSVKTKNKPCAKKYTTVANNVLWKVVRLRHAHEPIASGLRRKLNKFFTFKTIQLDKRII